jgi:hypothetical protein
MQWSCLRKSLIFLVYLKFARPLAFRFGRTHLTRTAAWLMALLVFGCELDVSG